MHPNFFLTSPSLILILFFFPSSNLLMAPDLNSLAKLPQTEHSQPIQPQTISYSATNSRRPSQTMTPPSVPTDRMQMPHRVSSGHEQDGPLRHPRPLTAAELYSECEKEQEAVVRILGTHLKTCAIYEYMLTKSLGQPPYTRAHRSSCTISIRCIKCLTLKQLDLSLSPPERHLRSQPDTPDDGRSNSSYTLSPP